LAKKMKAAPLHGPRRIRVKEREVPRFLLCAPSDPPPHKKYLSDDGSNYDGHPDRTNLVSFKNPRR